MNHCVIFDLSHQIKSNMPHWPGDPQTKVSNTASQGVHGFALNTLIIGEHSGTHLGAPCHFISEGKAMHDIMAKDLIVPAICVDVSSRVESNPDYLLSLNALRQWEQHHRKIPKRYAVIINTGWYRFWPDRIIYLGGSDERLHFPGIALETVHYLVNERGCRGIGIDTAGIDGGLSNRFEANIYLAEHGLFHLENLANTADVSNQEMILFIGALAIYRGNGSPCRVLALKSKNLERIL